MGKDWILDLDRMWTAGLVTSPTFRYLTADVIEVCFFGGAKQESSKEMLVHDEIWKQVHYVVHDEFCTE